MIFGIRTREPGRVLGFHVLNPCSRNKMRYTVSITAICRDNFVGMDAKAADVSDGDWNAA